MARFPKKLLLLAGALELLILSVNGHATTVAGALPLPQNGAVVARESVNAATAAAQLRAPSVFGLVRAEPPKQETTKKQGKKPSKRQSGLMQ